MVSWKSKWQQQMEQLGKAYFTIASTTACDKSVPTHTGIVAGALHIACHKLFE